MRLALIPPFSILHYTHLTDYQLMLPQLVGNEHYELTYKLHCKNPGTYVILDNGAAEGHQVTTWDLTNIAVEFDVDEIVIPDVIGDEGATREESIRFINELMAIDHNMLDDFEFMYVCQGQSIEEFVQSAAYANTLDFVRTIGVPRHALTTCRNKLARIFIANYLQQSKQFRKDIHFLGSNAVWAAEANYLSDNALCNQEHVRGMDTSMPFNYAYVGALLQREIEPVYRPEDYFELPSESFKISDLDHNTSILKKWARYR